jgi:two-component system sensor histidine kinase YesM
MKLYNEQDFNFLSEGFNEMTSSIKSFIDVIHRQEQENIEIHLKALQSLIKPHFLYNALECIHWQALMEGAPEASKMIIALSRYYRLCLSNGEDVVSLTQELENTESYVVIQNMRFDNIVSVEWNIPEELRCLEIPKITLQPLVENAIYHGIKPVDDRKGHILISAQRGNGTLIITVKDDGIGMSQESVERLNSTIGQFINDGSYGVKNVHKRLELRYGTGYGLYYEKNEMGV